MRARAPAIVLVSFAALLGLFEGPAEIAAAIALALLLIDRRFAGLRVGWIELGILVWIAAGIPGTAAAGIAWTSEGATRPILALGYLIGRAGIAGADERTLRRIGFAFALACTINGAYGILQVAWFDPPLERLIAGRLRSENLIDPDAPERLRMATGLFYSRLKLAHVGVLGLGLLGLSALHRSPGEHRRRGFDLAAMLILAIALLLTFRRAAPAALLGGALALALVLRRPRLAAGAAGAALLILLAMLATEHGRERVGEAQLALGQRFEIHRAALALFAEHPLLGAGHGTYPIAIQPFASALPPVLQTSAHQQVLQILAETGLIGLAGFSLAVIVALAGLVRRVRATREETSAAAIRDRFALLGLVTLLLLGLLHAVLYHRPVALAFWVLLGIAAGPIFRRDER